MNECEKCGNLFDPDDMHYIDDIGWVCWDCYQEYCKRGQE